MPLAVGLSGAALFGDDRPRIDIGAEPEQDGEVWCIAFFSTGQVEGDRVAVEVGLQVKSGEKPPRERPSARPFCPF
ncbi:hypothetical protein AB3G45_05470 [Shinella sp. S4-D37]|uniref:hypothetical protein n=1 Tax=Shinella sp. S4-D37 TaxID=3161999 RepID=UPI003465B24D